MNNTPNRYGSRKEKRMNETTRRSIQPQPRKDQTIIKPHPLTLSNRYARYAVCIGALLAGAAGAAQETASPEASATSGARGALESPPMPTPDALRRQFVQPPDSARPWVYWMWLGGSVNKEGITADLESLARAGIGGVLNMDLGGGFPNGPAKGYFGPTWLKMQAHAAAEAARLGLEININQSFHWTGCGGTWMPAELRLKQIEWSETVIDGGKESVVPRPANHATDIAALAFPTPTDDAYRLPAWQDKTVRSTVAPWAMAISKGIPPDPSSREPVCPAGAVISRAAIVDLSERMNPGGEITWTPPPGRWTVLRFFYVVPKGTEVDYLDSAAAKVHFDAFMKVLQDRFGDARRALVAGHVDSWEVARPTWTTAFAEEFRKRRGYDLRIWLPALTGRALDNGLASERFLWDYRHTIGELFAENFAATMSQLMRENGMRFTAETHHGTPVSELAYGAAVDEPMSLYAGPAGLALSRATASAAHTWGKAAVGAEMFTAIGAPPGDCYPRPYKIHGDEMLCCGVNRFVMASFSAAPWPKDNTMMSFGYELELGRVRPWWDLTMGYHRYLARCQHLLRQGLFAADLCFWRHEAIPDISRRFPVDGGAYAWDQVDDRVVLERMRIEKGRIVLPHGMSYRLLVMPRVDVIEPHVLRRVRDLVEAGMVIVGDPPAASPSLTEQPDSDREVRRLATELWGDLDGKTRCERTFGKGRVFRGKTGPEVLGLLGVPPDFTADSKAVSYIHRVVGDVDLYFVPNLSRKPLWPVTCSFRVQGKVPELWWPETGRIERAGWYCQKNGRTEMPLLLRPEESVFVVFRPATEGVDPAVALTCDGKPAMASVTVGDKGSLRLTSRKAGEYLVTTAAGRTLSARVDDLLPEIALNGPWRVTFEPGRGAPPEIQLDQLRSWHEHADAGVRYFSGKGTYHAKIHIPPPSLGPGRRLWLNLGQVAGLAKVLVNGREVGIAWTGPNELEITEAAQAGENQIAIVVANQLHNRLVGDAQVECAAYDKAARAPFSETPNWLLEGLPSPGGRYLFTARLKRLKPSDLHPSGLLGPVRIIHEHVQDFKLREQGK